MPSGRESGDSRPHSRSSSRKKHKKYRRHRSRSRSRTPKIHINPAFGYQQQSVTIPYNGGGMASQLLENNRYLESDVQRLRQELSQAHNNIQMLHQSNTLLTGNIKNLTNQKNNVERRCNELSGERRNFIESTCELRSQISNLENIAVSLRTELVGVSKKHDEKEELIKGYEYRISLIQQQIGALNDRNAGLKAKCEELVATNRHKQDEINHGKSIVEQAKINVKKMEADVQCANSEIQRLVTEIDTLTEKEVMWKKEKKSLEQALSKKNDEIRLMKFNSGKAVNEANEKLKKLESRPKTEKPVTQPEFATEAIYRALEIVKNTYNKQLEKLELEIEELKTQKEKNDRIEELPEYLQTPRKPDPSRMSEIQRTQQAVIPESSLPNAPVSSIAPMSSPLARSVRASSGPPVDSPHQWHRMRLFADNMEIGDKKNEDNGVRENEQREVGVAEECDRVSMNLELGSAEVRELFNEREDDAGPSQVTFKEIGTEFEVMKEEIEDSNEEGELEIEETEVGESYNNHKEDDENDNGGPPEKRMKIETLEVTSDESVLTQPSTSNQEWCNQIKNEVYDLSEDDLLGDAHHDEVDVAPIENFELIERQLLGDK